MQAPDDSSPPVLFPLKASHDSESLLSTGSQFKQNAHIRPGSVDGVESAGQGEHCWAAGEGGPDREAEQGLHTAAAGGCGAGAHGRRPRRSAGEPDHPQAGADLQAQGGGGRGPQAHDALAEQVLPLCPGPDTHPCAVEAAKRQRRRALVSSSWVHCCCAVPSEAAIFSPHSQLS